MVAKSKPSPSIETTWLRAWARSYEPSEGGFWFRADDLREIGLTLIDIRHAFKIGTVVASDKLEEPGARWIVIGEDCDGNPLMISIIVVTQELSVSLERVTRVQEAAQGKKEGNNVA